MITDGIYKFVYMNGYFVITSCQVVYNSLRILICVILENIWTGTDQRISDIDKKAKQELQVSVISSKLAIKYIFHQKCVYMLNDFFDDRKN